MPFVPKSPKSTPKFKLALASLSHQSVHVPVALVAGDEKGGAAYRGFLCRRGHSKNAAEIIDGLRQAGIKHVAFNPKFPIILQWIDGRAGGHHSYEDFHQPILAT
jgi:enoyl reductase-like protein